MDLKFLDIINDKVFNALEEQGFSRQAVDNFESDEVASLYISESTAYTVIYYTDKKHVVLRTCAMTDDGPDNEWKTLATWMFDPAVDTNKEAASIGNDFAESLSTPTRIKTIKSNKKKRSDDEGTNTPLFLAKRMVTLFPELRDAVKYEEDGYAPFRGVTFTKTHIVPKINESLTRGNKKEIDKISAVLNAQYKAGDMDTRSIITIIILNSVPESQESIIEPHLSEDLAKAWGFAKKFRGKTVKPEKVKEKKKSMAERLAGAE